MGLLTLLLLKTLWEMEKMLVTSIFSFSHNVFRRLLFKVIKSRDCVLLKQLCFPKPLSVLLTRIRAKGGGGGGESDASHETGLIFDAHDLSRQCGMSKFEMIARVLIG